MEPKIFIAVVLILSVATTCADARERRGKVWVRRARQVQPGSSVVEQAVVTNVLRNPNTAAESAPVAATRQAPQYQQQGQQQYQQIGQQQVGQQQQPYIQPQGAQQQLPTVPQQQYPQPQYPQPQNTQPQYPQPQYPQPQVVQPQQPYPQPQVVQPQQQYPQPQVAQPQQQYPQPQVAQPQQQYPQPQVAQPQQPVVQQPQPYPQQPTLPSYLQPNAIVNQVTQNAPSYSQLVAVKTYGSVLESKLPSNASRIRPNLLDGFSCAGRIYGYYADVLNDCQVFHVCYPLKSVFNNHPDVPDITYDFSFICNDFLAFDQLSLTCGWATEVIPCENAQELYDVTNQKFFKIPPPEPQGQGGYVVPGGTPPFYPGVPPQIGTPVTGAVAPGTFQG
ncbi:mediator of RNA polymerase II transcription subunit 15 [Hyalella azteca]|uniref:Mediator of RNA polymerase II transcription subunit 15 n=1 Tax=Hyalella azteca TaxID=294128 RepID=A0A8B7NQR4_HYAAZ|nr:mediator of RNA polymerase II transcription subunit 15 [Hyalella azteca]